MQRTRFSLAIFAAVAALTFSGCGEEKKPAPVVAAPPPPPAPMVVKIGTAGPLTGEIAHLGKDNENGVRLAIDEANAKGLTLGGKKVKLELLSEDDQADPKVGTTVAQKLVDAKVVGVVGHLNSGVSIPASVIYNQAGIPMISGSSTNPQLTEQGFKNVFRVVGRDDQQGPAIANYLASEVKPKKVAVIDDSTAYGEGLADEVAKTLKAGGIKVLPREKGSDKTVDFKSILTKIKGEKPNAVFYGGMDATGGPLLKQARELGIKVVFAFGDGACTDKMKESCRCRRGRDAVLAGRAPGPGCEQEIPRRLQSEIQGGSDPVRAVHLRRNQPDYRGDEGGEFTRSGEVPARSRQDQLSGCERQDRV